MGDDRRGEIDIFISHSSRDAELAKALAELFRSALNLSAKQIRCTSVSGYKLDVGADTNEQLRRETVEARVLVGLITEVSIESIYVLFELGARWGARKFLAPLIGGGQGANILAGPLTGLNALLCTHEDLLQLVANIATQLELAVESPDVYFGQVARVVAVSGELASQRGLEGNAADAGVADDSNSVDVSDFTLKYLLTISRPRNEGRIWGNLDDWSGREAAQYRDSLEQLQRLTLVSYGGGGYQLTTRGWKLADQLWQLTVLDALVEGESVKDDELATKVELTDGESEANELRRHLNELENHNLVTISKTRGPWHVRITLDGVTHRKHRPLTIS